MPSEHRARLPSARADRFSQPISPLIAKTQIRGERIYVHSPGIAIKFATHMLLAMSSMEK